MSGDHGAKALAEREIAVEYPGLPLDRLLADPFYVEWGERKAAAILGEHGLFVEDVREHEPHVEQGNYPTDPTWIACSCGWNSDGEIDQFQPAELGFPASGESYFDHIGTQP